MSDDIKNLTEKQRKRHATILRTARRLSGKVGYEGLTIRALAEEAGVSTRTLYNKFDGKDELLRSALEDLVGKSRIQMAQYAHLKGFRHILAVHKTAIDIILSGPGFADVILKLFFRSKPEDCIIPLLSGWQRKHVLIDLQYERNSGSIIDDINLERVIDHLVFQTFGTLFFWDKGIIEIEQVALEERRSYLMTLAGIAKGRKRTELTRELIALDRKVLV